MPTPDLTFRSALPADLTALHPIIERAYRGDHARGGWTHEADLLEGQRTDMATLQAILEAPRERLIVAEQAGALIGCVHVTDCGGRACYMGMLCVDPTLQASGLGRQLIAAAEALAVQIFGAQRMEMTVIDQRPELIAYYERRGYCRTGEVRDFPIAVKPPLFMAVLARDLP